MNDELLKGIQQLKANIQPLSETIAISIEQFRQAVDEMQKKYAPMLVQLSNSYRTWIKQNENLFDQLSKVAREWQENQKQSLTIMAQNGWFPNWLTFFYKPAEAVNSIDELMKMHLNDSWDDIVSAIIERCPERKHILEAAFDLHKSGNYIGSVPLFIAQADGIFCEEIKTFLFAGDKPKDILEQMIESGELQIGFFTDILLEPYKIKTQFSEGVRKSSKRDKAKAPNRNGILHGHRKHLDYGTEINSLKSFSLLAFVVFSSKDTFKKSRETQGFASTGQMNL